MSTAANMAADLLFSFPLCFASSEQIGACVPIYRGERVPNEFFLEKKREMALMRTI